MDSTEKTTEPPQLPPPPQAASPALISAVLGNDDILREILVRLDFPTCLVRAAAVSKRWLRHASDPAFLRRFRRLHPPRLLGFYLETQTETPGSSLGFIPLPQPPELAAVIRRGNFDLGSGARSVSCHNGRLTFYMEPDEQTVVCRPLHPGRGAMALPPPETLCLDDAKLDMYASNWMFRDDGGDNMSISLVMVAVMCIGRQAKVLLMNFQAGDWGGYRHSDMIQLPKHDRWIICEHLALLTNGKIYMMCMEQYILGLDVQSMSLFSIKLPNGVECVEFGANIALSRAEGSGCGFCLVHVKMFQISVWHYTLDYCSTGNWEMVDTISLPQLFGPNADPTWFSQGGNVRLAAVGDNADFRLAAVGDNADFVFLRINENVIYLHISSRTVEKVYELALDEFLFGVSVSPFMMVWPPTFPSLNGGHDNDE